LAKKFHQRRIPWVVARKRRGEVTGGRWREENVESLGVSVAFPADDTLKVHRLEEAFRNGHHHHHAAMLRAVVLAYLVSGLAGAGEATGPSGTNLSNVSGSEADRSDLSRTSQRDPGGSNTSRAQDIQAQVAKSQPQFTPHSGGAARLDPEITRPFDHRIAPEPRGQQTLYKRKGPYLPALGTEPYVRGQEVRGMGPGRPEQMPNGTVMKSVHENPWLYQTDPVRL